MATYLKYHQLERSPFEGKGSDQLVLATAALRRSYAEIKAGLEEGSPRICLSGGPGIGKSSLARALPKLLANDSHCVLVRDPSLDWGQIKASIAKPLLLASGQVTRSSLLAARNDGRRLVIVIDNAENVTAESLEHLDIILGYRDDQGEQLVQCVLLANLDDAPRGDDVPLLWWLDGLATRQLRFSPIPERGIRSYIDKHLARAGFQGDSIFTDDAIVAIHRYTGGVPGAVSALCEELLARAASARRHDVDAQLVSVVCGDDIPPATEARRPARAEPEIDMARPSPTPARASLPRPSPELREPEPDLRIQPGLLHMDESEAAMEAPARDDYFGEDRHPARRPVSARGAWPRQRSGQASSLGGGRPARMVRKLTMLALLACLAVAAHAWLTSDVAPDLVREVQQLVSDAPARKAAPAPEPTPPTVSVPPMVPPKDRDLASRSLALEDTQGRDETDAPVGLTSDLTLDLARTGDRANKPDAKAGAVAPSSGEAEAAAEEPALSLQELYELAEKAVDAAETFEPWSEQAPESDETVPAAPAPRGR